MDSMAVDELTNIFHSHGFAPAYHLLTQTDNLPGHDLFVALTKTNLNQKIMKYEAKLTT
jgi:hypothetical protein